MSRPMKYVAIVLALLLVAGAVTGVAYWSAQYDPDAPDPGYFEKGKKVENPPYFIKIGEQEIPFEIYRHYYLLYRSYFEAYYGAEMYENDPDGDNVLVLKQATEQQIQQIYIWLEIAKEEGITLSEEDLADMRNTLAEQKAEHGDDFDKYLDEMFYTSEENYLQITEMQLLMEKTKEAYEEKLEKENSDTWGKEADAEFEKDYISAKHILIMVETDEEATADSSLPEEDAVVDADVDADAGDEADAPLSAEQEAARARAYELYEQIIYSEDPAAEFDEVMNEFSEDGGLEANPDGYTFKEGDMVEIFYETAMGLEDGAIAAPVFSDAQNYKGYHIIMRVPLSEEEKVSNRESVISTKVSEMMTEKEEEMKEKLPIGRGVNYDKFKVEDIR